MIARGLRRGPRHVLKAAPRVLARRVSDGCRPAYARFGRALFKPRDGRRRINLGGGNWYKPGWENVDFFADRRYVDYPIDLRGRQPLPIREESAELIFSSHCLEHVSDDAALFTLGECYRVLRPGGVIRVAVPDMDKALAAYRSGDDGFFDSGGVTCTGDNIENKLVNFFASYATPEYRGGPLVDPMEVRDRLSVVDKHAFAQWCVRRIPEDAQQRIHVNAYDFTKLGDFLVRSGFGHVVKSKYRQSSVPAMRGAAFDVRPVVSLYVEAEKAGR